MPTTITSKGQVTIPKPIRDELHLKAGDKLEFVLLEDGIIQVLPATSSLKDLKGLLPKPQVSLSLEEMDEAIYQGVRARVFDHDRD